MNLLERLFGSTRDISNIDDYVALVNEFAFNGVGYGYLSNGTDVQQTLGGQATELAPSNFPGLSIYAYRANGPIFSCMLVRMLVFSSIGFTWQRMLQGLPSDTWANDPQLRLLQRPWKGGTTQDLLIRMIQDADLAGNAYIIRDGNDLVRLRPDWVDIVLEPRDIFGGSTQPGGGQIGWRKLGYRYQEGGRGSNFEPVFLPVEMVAHFHPIPDPLSPYRGMSWLTPILRELQADQAMTQHQTKFFENGATVNMVIKYQPGTTLDQVKAFKELFDEGHKGVENAYKTLHLAPGADPTPVGCDLDSIDFKKVRGGGETRIAAAAGVPPVIAGFSEGLAAATYSNYSQARRRFADGTMHPLWENVAGSLEILLVLPDAAQRLWYNASSVPFLREDEKDAADIQNTEAITINSLITAGYVAESVIAAVVAKDWRLLVHSGLVSVQLLPPGTTSADTDNLVLPTNGNGAASAMPEGKMLRALAPKVLQELANTGQLAAIVGALTNGGSSE